MSLTRAAVEAEVVSSFRGLLTNAYWQMSTLVNGSNPDLNGPIRRAILTLGGEVAGGLTVADADLAPFTGWDVERLIDLTKIQVLRACIGQSVLVDVSVDSDSVKLSQLAAQIQSAILVLEQRLSMTPAVMAPMNGIFMPNDPFQPCPSRSIDGHWPYP